MSLTRAIGERLRGRVAVRPAQGAGGGVVVVAEGRADRAGGAGQRAVVDRHRPVAAVGADHGDRHRPVRLRHADACRSASTIGRAARRR